MSRRGLVQPLGSDLTGVRRNRRGGTPDPTRDLRVFQSFSDDRLEGTVQARVNCPELQSGVRIWPCSGGWVKPVTVRESSNACGARLLYDEAKHGKGVVGQRLDRPM